MNVYEPTEKLEREWSAWVAERPDSIRTLIRERDLAPWRLYRMKSTGHRVMIVSFSEGDDGAVSLRVTVSGEFNFVAFERQVFGVDPADLEECDLPADDEPLGSLDLTIEEAREMIEHGKQQKRQQS